MDLGHIFNSKEIVSINEMVDYLVERNHYLNWKNINYYDKYTSGNYLVIGREDIDNKKIQKWLNLLNSSSNNYKSNGGLLNKISVIMSSHEGKSPLSIRKELRYMLDVLVVISKDLRVLLKINSKKKSKKNNKNYSRKSVKKSNKTHSPKNQNQLSREVIIKTILRKCSDKKYLRQFVDLGYLDNDFNRNLHIFSSTLSLGCTVPKIKTQLKEQLNSLSSSDFKKLEKKFYKSKK
jgi:hypothetical protein